MMVSKSVISPDFVQDLIHREYKHIAEDKAVSVEILCIGMNDTYCITVQNAKYIFRIYQFNAKSRVLVDLEINTLKQLNLHLINTSKPIQLTNQSYVSEIKAPEGIRYAILLSYLPGKLPSLTANTMQKIGNNLAALHRTLDQINTEAKQLPAYHENTEQIAQSIKTIYPKLDKHSQQQFKLIATASLTQIREIKSQPSICHGDYQVKNLLEQDEHIGVIDFDNLSLGPQPYDIATFCWKILRIPNIKQQQFQLIAHFLFAYHQHRPLQRTDYKNIELFISYRHLLWLHLQVTRMPFVLGTQFLSSKFYKLHTKWLIAWAQDISQKFLQVFPGGHYFEDIRFSRRCSSAFFNLVKPSGELINRITRRGIIAQILQNTFQIDTTQEAGEDFLNTIMRLP